MSKYDKLLAKIQTLKETRCSYNITAEEWKLIEEALITIQFLEAIFTIRERNLKDYE